MYDLAVIGGGPAGLTAAMYALRANRSVVLFEGKNLGGVLNEIAKIENYPAFKSVSGEKLAQKMSDQTLKLKPDVVRQFVLAVSRDSDGFSIFTPSDEFKAKRVIFCTGTKRAPLRAAAVFKGAGISYCAICDGFFYKNKTVVVAGDGYTALEDVHFLSNICKKVYWVSKSAEGGLKGKEGAEGSSVGSALPNVERIVDIVAEVVGTESVEGVRLKGGLTISADALFVATGTSPDNDLFAAVTDETASLSNGRLGKNAYVAGDASGGFKQIVWACAQGAHAATEIFKE